MSRTPQDSERLTTTDELGRRIYVHPESVKGKWRNRRNVVSWLLILVYFVLPWVYVQGKQIIKLDLQKVEFTFFGTVFYGHDAPLIFYIFLLFVLICGLMTSQWGRIWCGWGCPQTVFIDAVYGRIERMIEGKARDRKNLDAEKASLSKILKKLLKWFLFLLISLHLSHTFLGYFWGTRELFQISLQSPFEHLPIFITMLVVTGIFLFDFGWFREQFCLIACPYGRFQSVMMDADSLVVGYDKNRGEPRRNLGVLDQKDEGSCIDCLHCVKVCPTGIDIREGTQLECIACTNCIDACDEIMTKLKRPEGLIRYLSESELQGKKRTFFRLRPSIYLLIIALVMSGFIFQLLKRQELQVQFIRASKVPFQEIKRNTKNSLANTPQEYSAPQILNRYKLSVYYNGESEKKLAFRVLSSSLENSDLIKIITPKFPHPIHKNKKESINIFFKFPKSILEFGKKVVVIGIYDIKHKDDLSDFSKWELIRSEEVRLVGPFSNTP